MPPRSLGEIDIEQLVRAGHFTPSPDAWEDQVLYFLLIDRFSDNNESGYLDLNGNPVAGGGTPLFQPADTNNAVANGVDAAQWRDAGAGYVGGTLAGIASKLGYLKRLGITTLWLSPIFKQVAFEPTYHGYGIQDYLTVNPKFGTVVELRALVDAAHASGLRVILDIILNHTGNVFGYERNQFYTDRAGRWNGSPYSVRGYNDPGGISTIPFTRTDPATPGNFPGQDEAIWPVEFQDPAVFTAKGRISNWDWYPEYLEGDFFDLKDVHHGSGPVEAYAASQAFMQQIEVYKYWMAFADLDGYRIDSVKHMDRGAARLFGSAMKEFAARLNKTNFYLIAEIAGGRDFAFETLGITGLDAALGIDDTADKMEFLVKGSRNPADYFNLFRNSENVGQGSHTWFRNKIVTLFSDHDEIRKGDNKRRFCADAPKAKGVLAALALNAMTLGIPCIYYGTEQSFDGHGQGDGADRYIREAMFGRAFGAFASRGRHFFDESKEVYVELTKILAIRRSDQIYTRGRQYLRPISGNGLEFGDPVMLGGELKSIVPWSRIMDTREVLLAINTDMDASLQVWVTVDASLHRAGDNLRCIYSTSAAQIGSQVGVEARNGLAIQITVPAAGFAIYQ